jgi:hypothetical protein
VGVSTAAGPVSESSANDAKEVLGRLVTFAPLKGLSVTRITPGRWAFWFTRWVRLITAAARDLLGERRFDQDILPSIQVRSPGRECMRVEEPSPDFYVEREHRLEVFTELVS